MIGSAFIVHNETWSCSNDVTLGIYSTPIFGENNEIISIKEERTLTLNGLFSPYVKPSIGDKCDVVMLADNKYAFVGNIRTISDLKTVINITAKSDRISLILDKIKID